MRWLTILGTNMRSQHDAYLAALQGDWPVVPIDQIGELVGGGTPSRRVASFWGGDIPWATPSELTGLPTKWLTETREQITEAGLRSSAARLLPANTVLISTRATVGLVALAAIPMATNQGFRSLVCGPGSDPNFYYHLIKLIAPELRRLATGSTFDEISRADLARIKVPQPSLDEQREIAAVLDKADEVVQALEQETAKRLLVKDGLTRDLLSGARRLPAFAAAKRRG